tara:strand:- start:341 stop:562 length:222 start_codon:yes stop_codon:yes gene_type:complete
MNAKSTRGRKAIVPCRGVKPSTCKRRVACKVANKNKNPYCRKRHNKRTLKRSVKALKNRTRSRSRSRSKSSSK